ncbi:DUF3857 domain-containing protein [Runella sp. MFBS21]|uniref:DUF3857 domain-containing protein n=1 Tax=Runella sp. MFBS21 TaxID=3034018 RepID=UPI0023F8BBE2|nr:DUF3857 domain-containing protein [Runella sp. MFBS21]MDF7819007.1 DUF3857 domain-containing protein [Runella sp. MFBS21]
MKHFLWVALFLTTTTSFAQDVAFKKIIENQKVDPTLATLTESEQKESGVLLRNQIFIEYTFDSLGQFSCLEGIFKRIRINDSKSIEMYNKIVLPVPNTNDLLYLKARSISKNGTIKEVGLEAVKELEERGRVYKILAVEGLEVGGELEYATLFRRNSTLFGSEILQSDIPVRATELKIITPSYLVFEAKVYNAPANIETDTVSQKRITTILVKNLRPIHEEKYANLKANIVKADYKLSYNLSRGEERLYTWQSAAETFYDYLRTGIEESKADVGALLTKEKIKGLPAEAALKKFENYAKTNIAVKEEEEADIASDVLKKQYASKAGMMRLYISALEILNIPYEIVVGCSRADAVFDKEFDSWSFLDEYLLYFPATKKFLDPSSPILRYGMIDQYMEGNNALFIKTIKEGTQTFPEAEIRLIPFSTILDNHDDLMIDVSFSPTMDQVQGKVTRQMTGHQAAQLRPYYHFVKAEEERKQLTNEIIKSTLKPDVTYSNAQVKNTNLNSDEANKPFILTTDIALKSVLERAGKKYLFKIGELIGPQVEMYNERERQYSIDMGNAHAYKRVMKIRIPQGYKVSGLESLKRNITDGKAEPVMGFVSDYKLEAGVLTVTIDEFYKQVLQPIDTYESFQKIINAAADFNKVTLLLEKS